MGNYSRFAPVARNLLWRPTPGRLGKECMKLQATRWMGIAGVAAIAATAGGFGLVQAASGSGNLMTAITPCRLVDTRAASTIGPRSTPLGAGETATFAATGDNGQCTGIDLGAQAVEVQLTSTGATRNSYLTLFPANLAEPAEHLAAQPAGRHRGRVEHDHRDAVARRQVQGVQRIRYHGHRDRRARRVRTGHPAPAASRVP